MPPDDPKQTEGTVSGLGPATRPGIPQGYSEQRTSTPPSAPLFGQGRYDPATAAINRSTPGNGRIDPAELPPPSTTAVDLATLARRAGRK
jgi:hypothetical protein